LQNYKHFHSEGPLKSKKFSIEHLSVQITIYKGVVYYITKNFLSEALLTYFFISEITKDKEINPFSKSSNLRQRQLQG